MTAFQSADPGWPPRRLLAIFLAFAAAYFLSALLRAVTATLAPSFSTELGIGAAQLGLLAGAYFGGFALMQLPLGHALDRFGPKQVVVVLLVVAVGGCAAFAMAGGLGGLTLARAAIGVGVSACLMAPLTCFRRVMTLDAQLRANSWMLMTGSLGMMASTLPVQWLLPLVGWRGVFWALAGLLAASLVLIAVVVPPDRAVLASGTADSGIGYRAIVRHGQFVRMAPLGFLVYGGLIAVQALWAGPWLTRVAGWSADEAAGGLFAINSAMLLTFLAWGAVLPRLARRGWPAERLMRWGCPAGSMILLLIVLAGPDAGAAAWMAWCVATSFVTPSQPAIAHAFPAAAAGRALSAFNLVVFAGVFALQWGIGWAIDLLIGRGWAEEAAFRLTFLGYAGACLAGYAWFAWPSSRRADNAS